MPQTAPSTWLMFPLLIILINLVYLTYSFNSIHHFKINKYMDMPCMFWKW